MLFCCEPGFSLHAMFGFEGHFLSSESNAGGVCAIFVFTNVAFSKVTPMQMPNSVQDVYIHAFKATTDQNICHGVHSQFDVAQLVYSRLRFGDTHEPEWHIVLNRVQPCWFVQLYVNRSACLHVLFCGNVTEQPVGNCRRKRTSRRTRLTPLLNHMHSMLLHKTSCDMWRACDGPICTAHCKNMYICHLCVDMQPLCASRRVCVFCVCIIYRHLCTHTCMGVIHGACVGLCVVCFCGVRFSRLCVFEHPCLVKQSKFPNAFSTPVPINGVDVSL